jgi:hypothetical protein
VVRGGYARAYDANFMNLNTNALYTFPFSFTSNVSGPGAFQAIVNATFPTNIQPHQSSRTEISPQLRAPATDQFSLDVQRALTPDLLIQMAYIRTRGTGLLQVIDGNPCTAGRNCRPPFFGNRVDPNREVIQIYSNAGSSTYDAFQASVSKRLTGGFSAGVHYTWSSFIDDGSDIFAPSPSEIPVAQDPFNRRGERARSSYDRPHRLTGNFVLELPGYGRQRGLVGHILGGWQINSVFTFQSGAPFTVSLGSDPGCAVCGISTSVRPNLNTNLNLSNMTITEVREAGGRALFRNVSSAERVGDARRNLLRADGVRLADIGFIKNSRVSERVELQLRADMFNAFNERNFGIPASTWSQPGFLNQWATDGGNRRIVIGARLKF